MSPTAKAPSSASAPSRVRRHSLPALLTHARLACALLLLALFAGHAWAQTGARYDGLQIVEVVFRGLETLSEDTVEHYLLGVDRGEGRTLDRDALNERVDKLWKRELIDDITIRVEPVTGGVRLLVDLAERPILTSVEYVGIKRVSRGDISEASDRDRVSVYESQPLQRGELERLKRVIEELYKEKGYRFAQVRYVLEDSGTGQRRVTYTIDEGDKVKIGDIEFDGNTVYGDWRLRLVMKETKKSNLISRISKKDIYNPATIEEDLDRVRELYRKAGYKDVLIAKPEIDVVARRPDAATIADQKRRLAVTVPIEEGERWRFGEVSIEGNEVFSDELLLAQFDRPRGGWLRSKVVDDAVETISKLYSSIGYIFSSINAETVERGDNVADVIVYVDEADQFKVGRIEFEGNTKTQDKVLRRELLVQEGRVMNMTAVQNSLLKIRQLNYFAVDEEEPVQFDFDAEDKKVDLTIKGEEAERTELQFGGGWSEVDGFFGQFSLRTTNFLGRGETVGVSFQSGRQREFYDLEYRVPWFLDRPQSIGFRVFNQEFDSDILTDVEFQQSFSGASLTYGRSFRNFQSLSVTYSFADVDDTRTIIDPTTGELLTSESNFKTSTIRPFWIRNTLDSRFEPTRGLRASAAVDIAGGFLGGEAEYVRPQIEATWFRPVSRQPVKSYFGINFEAGYIEPLGDPTPEDPLIFPQQRFFLGGDNSIRGFSRRSVVVRNEDGSIRRDESLFPLGGSAMLLLNLEYHIQAGGPFRVVVFADAGGVFDTRGDFGPSQSIDPDLFRYSAGVELRVKVPIFPAPLRFIYATNIDPLPDDQFDSFDFSLSTAF
ncbi:MAG: outer membrane protein assembly factor BamA [Acidobacteriota bacterium]